MANKRSINKMVQDVRDGLTDGQLMEKYHLSSQGLEHFYNRGLSIGKLEIDDLQRDNGGDTSPDSPYAVRNLVLTKVLNRRVGLQDIPSHSAADWLDNNSFAASLGEFILRCDTPTTISVQGDWGAGKSTLLNLIQGYFDKAEEETLSIEFNCWDYSQFGGAEHIPIFLMIHFTKAIESALIVQDGDQGPQTDEKLIQKNRARKELLSTIRKFAWGMTKGFASNLSQQLLMGVDVVELSNSSYEAGQAECSDKEHNNCADPGLDYLDRVVKIKDGLRSVVNDYIVTTGASRIVVFIDDLDRLSPPKAIELLEATKTFLDIKGCVFVVACDQEIVNQGIRAKFQGGISSVSGKSFLDKIFQLSVNMPTGRYNIRKYLMELLKNAKFDYPEEGLEDFLNLLRYSVGFNPRNVKRLINSLILLSILSKTNNSHSLSQDNISLSERKQKLFFGIGCMQSAYNDVYQKILENLDSDLKIVSLLQDKLRKKEYIEAYGFFLGKKERDRLIEKLSNFMDVFFRILDTGNNNNKLDREEIEVLRDAFSIMSITCERAVQTTDLSQKTAAVSKLFFGFKDSFRDKVDTEKYGHIDMSPKLLAPESESPYVEMWPIYSGHKRAWIEGANYRLSMDTKHFDSVILCLECDPKVLSDKGIEVKAIEKLLVKSELEKQGFRKVEIMDSDNPLIRFQKDLGAFKCSCEDDITKEDYLKIAEEFTELYKSTHEWFQISMVKKFWGSIQSSVNAEETTLGQWPTKIFGFGKQNQGAAPVKRKFNTTELASDIIKGASEADLMTKYNINAEQLRILVDKLIRRNHINQEDLENLYPNG